MIYKIINTLSVIIGSIAVIMGVWLWSILAVTNYEIDIAEWMPITIAGAMFISFLLNCLANVLFEVKIKKNKGE